MAVESDSRTILHHLLLTRIDLCRITNSIGVQQPHGRWRRAPGVVWAADAVHFNNCGDIHICRWRSVKEEGDKEEAKRKTLAAEDEREEVSTHRPVVVSEARPLLIQTRLLLPGKARSVDQGSKQHRRLNHTYGDQQQPTTALIN